MYINLTQQRLVSTGLQMMQIFLFTRKCLIGCSDITCFCRLGHVLCYCYVNIIVGCLNGGGQVRASESVASKELLDRVEAIYSAVK